MSTPITPFQRQYVANLWRHHAPSYRLSHADIEIMAAELLNGRQDAQIQALLERPHARGSEIWFTDPFGWRTGVVIPELGVVGEFAPMLQQGRGGQMGTMVQQTALQPFMPVQPVAPTPLPLAHLLPAGLNLAIPEYQTQSVEFPGGSAQYQGVRMSGQHGNASFSYSSSSTNATFSSTPGMVQQLRGLQIQTPTIQAPQIRQIQAPQIQVPAIQTPAIRRFQAPEIQAPAPVLHQPFQRNRVIAEEPATVPVAVVVEAPPPEPIPHQSNPRISGTGSRNGPAPPDPQNTRLANRLREQLDNAGEDTYFSWPPGAPDQKLPDRKG